MYLIVDASSINNTEPRVVPLEGYEASNALRDYAERWRHHGRYCWGRSCVTSPAWVWSGGLWLCLILSLLTTQHLLTSTSYSYVHSACYGYVSSLSTSSWAYHGCTNDCVVPTLASKQNINIWIIMYPSPYLVTLLVLSFRTEVEFLLNFNKLNVYE